MSAVASSGYRQWSIAVGSQLTFNNTTYLGWDSTAAYVVGAADVRLYPDAAGKLALRNGTSPQGFSVYNTHTSATAYERINIKGVAAANFEIGPENGSAGGTLRGLTLGGYSAGSSTITPWLSFTNAGVATFGPSNAVFGNYNGSGADNLTLTGAGPGRLVIARSGNRSFSLGDSSGDNFVIQNVGDNTDMLRIHGGTKVITVYGNVSLSTVGSYIQYKSGTGQRAGNATLVAGTVTVTNTSVSANTVIMLARKTSGGTIGTAVTYTVSAGASFTITSDNILDTSVFSYELIEVV